MNNAFNSLPSIYKIAVLLGARVQAYMKREDKWEEYYRLSWINPNVPLRLIAGDENILAKIEAILPQFYKQVQYKGYGHLIPENALKPGTIIVMQRCFGEYVQVQPDGSLKELTIEEGKAILEASAQHAYSSMLELFFLGKYEELDQLEKDLSDA